MQYKSIAPMMSQLWSPMAAVTSSWQGKLNAQIVVAVGGSSIVPSQPRIAAQIYKSNFTHDQVYHSGVLAVNFLRRDQLHLVSAFGLVSGRDADKLSGIAHRPGDTGCPVLEDCWGYLDCRILNAMDGGDMTCFLAEVVAGECNNEEGPLWWRDAARQLPQDVMQEWDRKIQGEIQVSTARMKDINPISWDPGSLSRS